MIFKDLRTILLKDQRMEIKFWEYCDDEEVYRETEEDAIYDRFFEDLPEETWFENHTVLFIASRENTSTKLSIALISKQES